MDFIALIAAVTAFFIAYNKREDLNQLKNRVEELERKFKPSPAAEEEPKQEPGAEEEPAPEPEPQPIPQSVCAPIITEKPVINEPAKPAKPPFTLPKINWENFTGAKLFSWIGAVALFFGVAFFVKYSIDNALLSPALRTILSVSAGLICIALGLFIKKKAYKTTAVTLTSSGVAILYASVFAAQYFYAFISLQSAFLLMGAVAVGGYALAMRLNSKAAALLCAAMGFLLPFINELPYEKQFLADGFILILNIGAAALAFKKKWPVLIKFCAVCTTAVIISAVWDAQIAALLALLVLNAADLKNEENNTFRPWLVGLTYGALFVWCLRNEAGGENALLLALAALSAFYFILAKIKRHSAHIIGITLPFLSILYVYLNFRPDMLLVLKGAGLMLLMYGAAVYFTLTEPQSKAKYLYLPLGAAFASLFVWNVRHLAQELLVLSVIWGAAALLVPFITMLLTRLGDNKETKNVFIHYTLISALIPLYILQTLGGTWAGFYLGFALVALINLCLLFVAFDDKKNYGQKLVGFTAGATFLAEIFWAGANYKAFSPYLTLFVFMAFSALYAGCAFVLRKSAPTEEDGPAGVFVLVSMLCASCMTGVITESAQIVYGSLGFLFASTVLLVALIYNRKRQGGYIAAAALITFFIQAALLVFNNASIYVKAGGLLPFLVLYSALPLLKGIKTPAAKACASAFLTLNTIFVLTLANKNFHIVTGLMLFINAAGAYLYFKESAPHNIQFRITGVMAFLFSLILIVLDRPAGQCMAFFVLLFLINGMVDYLKNKKAAVAYTINAGALLFLFSLNTGFAGAWLALAAMAGAFIWFNLRTDRQGAAVVTFIGAMCVLAALPSVNPKLGLVYIFVMTTLHMLPALISKAQKKDILHGVAMAAGACGFGMMYYTAAKLWPGAHGVWPVLWAGVFAAFGWLTKNKFYKIFAAALIVAAVPIQFNGYLVTILWALEGMAFMLYGLIKKSKFARFTGSGLLLFVTFKLFFVDLWHLGGLYRVGAFIGTAVMLIAVSFFYQKFIKDN